MNENIAGLRKAFKSGKISRRELVRALGVTASAALAAGAFPEVASYAGDPPQMGMSGGNTALKAVAYNHINYQVSDYAKVRDFYVSLLGMKDAWDDGKQCSVECGDPPNAIYIRPLTKPLDRPAGNWSAQMGQGNVDHFAIFHREFRAGIRARRARAPRPRAEAGRRVRVVDQGPERHHDSNLRDARRISRRRGADCEGIRWNEEPEHDAEAG